MGMPCEVNSILKLKPANWPETLIIGQQFETVKSAYRIFPMDVPIQLVNQEWQALADVVIRRLIWQAEQTTITYEIQRVYDVPFSVK